MLSLKYIIKTFQKNRKDPVPLFIHTYGGPGSQSVKENSGPMLWYKHLVNKYDIAIASIDPIGTGYQGAEKMFRFEKL